MRRVLRGAAICLAVVGVTFISGSIAASSAKPACRVTGVWELTGITRGGKPVTGLNHQRKIVTKGHFMWINQASRRDTLPLKTAADSLLYYRVAGGAGTYSLAGRSYTEHIEYFIDPAWIGTHFKATCRTEGDRWFHSYPVPATSDTSSGAPQITVSEEWRRIE